MTQGADQSLAARALRPNWMSLEAIIMTMGVIGLIAITVLASLVAWNERLTLLREAKQHAEGSAFFLADHAQRLFEVSDIALQSTILVIGTQSWNSLEASQTTWASLRDTNALLPYVDQIWLNDATGLLRMTTVAFPSPFSDARDRDLFKAVKAAGDELVIGDRIIGRVIQKPTFIAGRRLTTPEGQFRGMASVTLDLAYFTDYWNRLDLPNEERVAVVRAEKGDVLTSYRRHGPAEELTTQSAGFLTAIAQSSEAGTFEAGSGTYGFYHRVGTLPVYITVEFARSAINRAWKMRLLRLLPLAGLGFVFLAALTLIGLRQGRREAEATRALAATRSALALANRDLERRVSERTADLQETNEEIQRFAYIVSHDLRAPLVNIMGFTAELHRLRAHAFPEAVERSPGTNAMQEDFDEAIGFIQSSIEKMDRLINAILTLSRQGRRRFHCEAIDMTTLMQSIAGGVAHRAQEAGATIVIGPLPIFRGDRIALEQIFANLIDNSIKYLHLERQGHVAITGALIDGVLHVRVEDNGRGIDVRDHERVFELFRRAGPQDQPGEGIGLAHVRGLVRRLGGTITLESQFGQGAIFRVELPEMTSDDQPDPTQ